MEIPDKARTRVAHFEIFLTRFLNEAGTPECAIPASAREPDKLRKAYRWMLQTRRFEEKAVALQRTGKLGTYASGFGQEAVNVAIGLAMAADDVYISNYRECGVPMVRGVPMAQILQYWGGDFAGMAYPADIPAAHDFPFAVPVASQVPQAVGVGYAMKLRRQSRAVLVSCGDGATSKGDFAEAVSAAGTWKLPIVFVVINNQWAISLPREKQCAAETLAQKGLAGGLACEQVDGNDAIATQYVLEQALARARHGEGPQLVEALTYRLTDHTTADDSRRYRDEAEVETARAGEPVQRLRTYLRQACDFTDAEEAELKKAIDAELQQAVSEFQKIEPPQPGAMFEHLHAELPRALQAQREQLVAEHASEA